MKKLIFLILLLVIFSSYNSFPNGPPMSEGTANGIILYSKAYNTEAIYVLDFQKTKAIWGHMCTCHIGIGCSTTSGKTEFFYLFGDGETFTIRFTSNILDDYVSAFELSEDYYSIDKFYDGSDVCIIIHIKKRIELNTYSDKNKVIYIEPKSVLVFYFKTDYDEYFK